MKNKQGQAGLNVYLSIISMLFLIGLLVYVFSIAGGKLQASTFSDASGSIKNETLLCVNGTGVATSVAVLVDPVLSVTAVYNATNGLLQNSANYTTSAGNLICVTSSKFNGNYVNMSATYTYHQPTDASRSINNSVSAIAGSIDWFSTFIVLGAMVVLILLIVIIINSIRRTGIVGNEGA